MSKTTLERLREATRNAHEGLEARLDILNRMDTLAGRQTLAAGFHAFHAGVELATAPHLANLPGLEFASRRRTPLLEADLERLGVRAGAPASVAPPRSVAEALGLLYVVEGSSLGGKVIAKQAAARGLDLEGLSFLNPYGERTGEYWKGFLSILDRECPAQDPGRGEAAARAAASAFAHAEITLCGGAA